MSAMDDNVDPDLDEIVDDAGADDGDDDTDPAVDLGALRNHVRVHTIVLPEHRVLFMPTPKAACTTILWQLAALGGQPLAWFDESPLSEVSTALTIHDMNRWDSRFRFGKLSEAEQQAILADDSWFRFTTVRNPATRVWSAWQSKLLLREPRFVAELGGEPWFPRIPDTPDHVIEDFRKFVAALTDPDLDDVHWTLQRGLLGDFPFTHIGRSEAIDDTIALLTEHLSTLGFDATLVAGRDNRTPLRFPASAYDAAAAAVVNERYADDFATFGYDPVSPAARKDAAWAKASAPILPLLGELIERNARVGQLSQVAKQRGEARLEMAQRATRAEKRLERNAGRRGAPGGGPSSPIMTNREHIADYAVHWAWDEDTPPARGFTAIVRVKNEARPLPFVLPPLLRALPHVVLVDNASTDGTPDLAREIAEREGRSDKLRVVSYPFDVARCGPEHLGTPASSVHSLTYFYNWSFSQVRTTYALKWDGDMVLSETGVNALRDLDWQLEATVRIITMPRYPLYIADDHTAFLDVALANNEPWGWPNRPGYSHVKALDWELPLWPSNTEKISLPAWSCVELKWLDADEFAHWSTTDFTASARTKRKEREWQVHQTLASGAEPPEGVVPVHAPGDQHVVDFVRREWLTAERPRLAAMAAEFDERRELAKARSAQAFRNQARRRTEAAYRNITTG